MIGSIRGTLLGVSRTDNPQINIEVDGIGYRVNIGKSALPHLGETNSEIFVFTSHQVREDSETLYGFMEQRDRDGFEILLKAHKVGPAMAMDIIDTYNLDQLQEIVLKQDLDALRAIKNVGKMIAERLLVDLKNKLNIPDVAIDAAKTPPGVDDVRKALLELGYSSKEILPVLQELDLSGSAKGDTEELLKQALILLGPKE